MARERAKRATAHAQHRAHKQGRKTTPSAAAQRYAHTWVFCITAPMVAKAVAEYAGRMSIEEICRDGIIIGRSGPWWSTYQPVPRDAVAWGRLLGLYVADARGPAGERGPGGSAAAGTLDIIGFNQS